jgi:hypothetical protein
MMYPPPVLHPSVTYPAPIIVQGPAANWNAKRFLAKYETLKELKYRGRLCIVLGYSFESSRRGGKYPWTFTLQPVDG